MKEPRSWHFARTADINRILQSLGELPPPRRRSALVVVAGLPGTGKSQFCRDLARRTAAVIIQSDVLRRLLFERPTYSWQESRRLFAAIHATTRELLRSGISCIVDATNLAKHHRQPLYDIGEREGAKLIVVEVTAPAEVALKRLTKRAATGESVSEADIEVYNRMLREWEEIERDHFVVDTSKATAGAVAAVAREMESG
jgi:predicted kinase